MFFAEGHREEALRLVIASEGEAKEILEKLAKALGIADRVPVSRLRFRHGFVSDFAASGSVMLNFRATVAL